MKYAIATHLSEWNRMDADHQTIIAFIFFDHLQSTGLTRVTTIECVTQHQQYRLITCKVSRLINCMPKAALFALINITKSFANAQDPVLIFLSFRVQLAQMFI